MSPDAENMTILKSTRMVGPASGVSSPAHSVVNIISSSSHMYVADCMQQVNQHQRPPLIRALMDEMIPLITAMVGAGYTAAWGVCSPAARVTPPLRHRGVSYVV